MLLTAAGAHNAELCQITQEHLLTSYNIFTAHPIVSTYKRMTFLHIPLLAGRAFAWHEGTFGATPCNLHVLTCHTCNRCLTDF